MSDLLRSAVYIDDLVERYESLRGEVEQRLEGVAGSGDVAQVRRLGKEVLEHSKFVFKTLIAMDWSPSPEIGDAADVVPYEHDERGDYCDDF